MLIDLHVHTTYGSSCSRLNPQAMIRQAEARGLDGICVTEHDQVWEERRFQELQSQTGLLLIRGMEVTTDLGHILVFGLPTYISGIYYARKLRQVVDQFGGVMVLGHPVRNDYYSSFYVRSLTLDLEEVCNRPVMQLVDALEVFNGCAYDEETRVVAEVCRRTGLKGTGGSDAHAIEGLGYCLTEFGRNISSLEEFLAEFKTGNFQAVNCQRQPAVKFSIG